MEYSRLPPVSDTPRWEARPPAGTKLHAMDLSMKGLSRARTQQPPGSPNCPAPSGKWGHREGAQQAAVAKPTSILTSLLSIPIPRPSSCLLIRTPSSYSSHGLQKSAAEVACGLCGPSPVAWPAFGDGQDKPPQSILPKPTYYSHLITYAYLTLLTYTYIPGTYLRTCRAPVRSM